jgi:hypothetical protein
MRSQIAFARGAWGGLVRIPDALSSEDRVERGGEPEVPVSE